MIQEHCIHGVTVENQKIVGGANNVDIDFCNGWTFNNVVCSNPRGTPDQIGSDWHNFKAWSCKDLKFVRTKATSKWKRGDAYSIGNCRGVLLDRVRSSGKFFGPGDPDIAADICIDGTENGGDGITLRLCKVCKIVIAAGENISLFGVTADVVELSGEQYSGNAARMILDVTLTGCKIGELYVHEETVTGLQIVDSVVETRTC